VFDAPGGNAEAAAGAQGSHETPGSHTRPSAEPDAVGINQRLAIAGVLAAIVIGGLAVVIATAGAGAGTVDGPDAAAGAVESGSPGAASGQIVVDVAGAVVTPGVYRLATGARVGDAIEAAGGFSPRVDADRVGVELNLAAALADGAQIRVPSRDDAAPASGGTGGGSGGRGGGSQLVNLNTATEAELDALSGIGPVTAGKIIESRAGAPFRTVDELRERGLIGEKTFEKIRALLTVG
jgi:competence protein ComEA